MLFTDFIVIEVMGWGDLNAASTKFRVDIVVCNNRNTAADQRQGDVLTMQCLITLVIRMHGDTDVTEHSFRAGCGDN